MYKIQLKDLTIETPILLGPMAGITDLPFRLLCREMGAELVFTEMVSAKAVHYKNKNTDDLMKSCEADRPLGLQLFGEDPEIMAEIAAQVEDQFDLIDINMGCPVLKVVRNGEGSALMREPKKVEKILTAVCKKVHKPVSVKIRKGFSADECTAPEIAKIAENSGVSMVTVHGRTREQFFKGTVDYDCIRKVKESVSIPVIGNGDIVDGKSGERMLKETGCDGIMIGQGAMGNPWVFQQVSAYLKNGEILEKPGKEEILKMLIRHTKMVIRENGEYMGIRKMRSHAGWYLQGFPSAARLRNEINHAETYDEFVSVLRLE